MNAIIKIQLSPGSKAAPIFDPFYDQKGKSHLALDSDLFFVAFLKKIVGVCRFCIEEDTPMFRSMIVHAPLRYQKIGSRLLESFAIHLDQNNYKTTYCIPYDHLENFYGLIGFKIINEIEAPIFLQKRIQTYRRKTSDKYMIMRRD